MYPLRRTSHNWLIKQIANQTLSRRLPNLTGVVVDLGCGTAPFRHDIPADLYVGVDWGHCLHEASVDVVADLNRPLPFPDDIADHVITLEVLEHLAEPSVMLAEAKRILRAGGELTLSTPFQWWEHEAPWDYQRFTRHGLRYQLEKAGFVDVRVVPTTGFWSMWLLKLNYQLARLIRGPRVARIAVRVFLVPVWWLNQVIAPFLDRVWPEERESAGHFATARKP